MSKMMDEMTDEFKILLEVLENKVKDWESYINGETQSWRDLLNWAYIQGMETSRFKWSKRSANPYSLNSPWRFMWDLGYYNGRKLIELECCKEILRNWTNGWDKAWKEFKYQPES